MTRVFIKKNVDVSAEALEFLQLIEEQRRLVADLRGKLRGDKNFGVHRGYGKGLEKALYEATGRRDYQEGRIKRGEVMPKDLAATQAELEERAEEVRVLSAQIEEVTSMLREGEDKLQAMVESFNARYLEVSGPIEKPKEKEAVYHDAMSKPFGKTITERVERKENPGEQHPSFIVSKS